MAEYKPTKWQDSLFDDQNNRVQKGTDVKASIMNNIEQGIVGLEEEIKTLPKREELDSVTQQLADTAINVKKFGAKGDGISDDTVAIQSAAEHMRFIGGGTLLFPKGVYVINDYIYIKTGDIKILGYGAKLKFKTVLDRALIIRHPNNSSISEFSATDRISNVSVEGIECEETTTGAFLLAQNIDGLEIKNIKVGGKVASNAISLYYCTGFVINNNNLLNNPSYGIFVYQCKDGVVGNNLIDGCMRGIVVKSCFGAGTSSEQRKVNIKVVNNSIYDANTDGISGGVDATEPTVENVIIEGNSVVSRTSTAGKEGIRPASESRNWIVKNNILKNCRILISDGGSGGHIVEGNQIDIAEIITPGFDAIGVYGDTSISGYNIVSNNIIKLIKNSNVRGITLKSGFNSIKGNVITGGDPAIDLRDESDIINNIIEGNIIKDFRIGIFARNDAGSANTGNVIRNNKLSGDSYVSSIVATNRIARKIVLEGNSIVGGIAAGDSDALGYAVIPASQTKVTVSHGLYTAPQFVLVTPLSNVGSVWVESITATTFDIVCSVSPVANANLRWYASL